MADEQINIDEDLMRDDEPINQNIGITYQQVSSLNQNVPPIFESRMGELEREYYRQEYVIPQTFSNVPSQPLQNPQQQTFLQQYQNPLTLNNQQVLNSGIQNPPFQIPPSQPQSQFYYPQNIEQVPQQPRRFGVEYLNPVQPKGTFDDIAGRIFRLPTLPAGKYHNRGKIVTEIPSKTDWVDDNLKTFKKIILCHVELSQILALGEYMINSFNKSISEKSIGTIFILAWNLIGPNKERVFPAIDPCHNDEDSDYNKLSETGYTKVAVGDSTMNTSDEIIQAQGFTYLAASMLRWITKDSMNFVNAWLKVSTTFESFYGYPFPLINFTPTRELGEAFKYHVSKNELLKNSVAGFLYLHKNPDITSQGLRSFLFEQHLGYTGMHLYTLMAKIVGNLRCSVTDFFRVIYEDMYTPQLDEIETIVKVFVQGMPEKPRHETWKYARIFTSDYFSAIQTKNCVELVALFAFMVDILGIQTGRARGASDILQVRQMRKDLQIYLTKKAVRMLAILKQGVSEVDLNNIWAP